MSSKAVILRRAARGDIHEAVAHYRREAGRGVAIGFLNDLEAAVDHIAHNPQSGSPRYGHELHLPGLRSWRLHSHPYLLFYQDAGTHIDVWRVLHAHRDIPVWLREESSPTPSPSIDPE